MSPEELQPAEEEISITEKSGESAVAQEEPEKAAPKPKMSGKMMSFDDESTDDDDLF